MNPFTILALLCWAIGATLLWLCRPQPSIPDYYGLAVFVLWSCGWILMVWALVFVQMNALCSSSC